MGNNSVESDRKQKNGFVVEDDGTIIVYLSGGDIVYQFPDGREVVRYADGTNVGWDSHSNLV